MMNSLGASLRSLFSPPAAAAESGWRGPLVRVLLAGVLVVGLLALAPAIAAVWGTWTAVVVSLVYFVMGALVTLRSPYRLQLVGLIMIVYALGLAELLNTRNPAYAVFYFLVSVVFATMLWSLLAGAVTAAVTLLTLGAAGIMLQFGASTGSPAVPLADWIGSVVAIMLAALAVIAGFQQSQAQLRAAEKRVAEGLADLEAQRATLEQRVEDRTLQWRAGLEVGQAASAIHDPEQLTAEIVNLISDRFGFYYAAIFLLNEAGDTAELHSATGEAGRLLKQNRHSLPVGGRSMVGTAISGRQARVALDTDAETARFANPLLPYTRSEIAVPLILGDRVLGALDVQSTSPNAFGQAEIDTLQGMANQVAIAFENARLFQASRQSLEELQAIQRQYVSSAWQPLTGRSDLEYSLGDEENLPGSAQIDVPLSLRDQIIGGINLSAEGDWTPEQRGLVEAIATQAALALENARLVESTQSTAQRERTLAEITGKVWSSTNLEDVLSTTVTELGRALEARQAVIAISMEGLAAPGMAFEYSPTGTKAVAAASISAEPGSLRLPLNLRGQEIGSVVLARQPGEGWTDVDRDLGEKVVAQTGLAIENVRLLEETRARALQERQLSELSARLSQSVDLDSLLQTAVRELAMLPEVADAAVYLSPSATTDEAAPPRGARD